VIGAVTQGGALHALYADETVGRIPARLLTDECPRYDVEQRARPDNDAAEPQRGMFASKRWIYEQYDCLVGSRTVRRPGLDAAVLRLAPSLRGLAVSLQGSPVACAPFDAGAKAVFGAARNVACAGGQPLGLTDCLNFGNPEKAEVAWELAQAIDGIAAAANALGIPVVSGNVSLYNETLGRPIPPTPVVGCVALVPDVRRIPGRWRAGDAVLLASVPAGPLDPQAEAALIRFLWKAAPLLTLSHDVGAAGLEAALDEAGEWSGRRAEFDLPSEPSGSAAILACAPEDVDDLGSRGLVRIGEVS
jgi:phosphoribosylformylglycinamidine synthase